MRDYWNSLQSREQWLIMLGGGVLLMLLLYLVLWEPVVKESQQLEQSVINLERDLAWMAQAAEVVQQLQQRATEQGGAGSQPLLTIVDRTLKQFQLGDNIERVQPEGSRVQIRLKEAAFDQVLSWIDQLDKRHNLTIDSLVVERSDALGRVNTRLVVGREAG
ncbi:type II secretion system protein M [Ectothiorhodospiraceae bacterium BW-2]|nr:type II secretion system protein M [Ectothiorhodospiraceae bacterium BW-2]